MEKEPCMVSHIARKMEREIRIQMLKRKCSQNQEKWHKKTEHQLPILVAKI